MTVFVALTFSTCLYLSTLKRATISKMKPKYARKAKNLVTTKAANLRKLDGETKLSSEE